MATQILDHQEIMHKSKRIAYQIAEVFADEQQVILAGIAGQGYLFSQMLEKELLEISHLNVLMCEVLINKQKPLEAITTSMNTAHYENQNVVLCDDVLNSGTTLIYGVKHFLEVPLKKFKTAVLINRNHKKYPVKADFKGLSLSTNMKEHIHVNLSEQPFNASLV